MRLCFQTHFSILFPILLAEFLGLTISQTLTTYCIQGGNYTNNSTYQSNLDALLLQIPSHTNQYGFGNSSFGQDPDTAYSLTLCRGDVETNSCSSCVRELMRNLTQSCRNHKDAVGWVDNCTVRYSSKSLYDKLSYNGYWCDYFDEDDWYQDRFSSNLTSFLDGLRKRAALGGSHRKLATGNMTLSDSITIQGLMQCTPDLSEDECSQCLQKTVDEIQQCAPKKLDVVLSYPSCNTRYATNLFYGDTAGPKDDTSGLPPSSSRANETDITGKGNRGTTMIIIILALSIASIILLIFGICLFLKKKKLRTSVQQAETWDQNESSTVESSTVDDIKIVESLQYDFTTVSAATNNFSNENKLGSGGFGVVYKGVLPEGVEIAVKRLSKNSHQGKPEFKNEVMLVANLQHRNLVRLLGFCYKQYERLLIYEFMTNSSLDHYLFDPVKSTTLNWDKRYKIIGGIARGLLYLHEDSRLRIIHRDLKSSNILLDDKMNPKISDFGIARLFVMDETHGSTDRIAGTYGYMAPEYAMQGHFSVKSDVFSFGVLILEIVSGQKNSNFCREETVDSLLSFAWNSWRKGRALDLVNHSLLSTMDSTSGIVRCIHIGLLCVHENPVDRPTMAQVVLMLTSMSVTLPVPSQPAYFHQSNASHEMPLLSEEHDSEVNDRSSNSINKTIHSSDYEASIDDTSITEGVLPDGVEIAVKRLSENSHQGEVKFKNEVVLVAKLQHRNLVRLLGFSYKENERLLIYELMTNSSLDHFIFDPVKRTILNWDKRYKIIGGIARGLLYLHEDSRLRIIHRDLKASNVLLDDEMNPNKTDFGMARLFVMDETHGSTRRIAGTYGYMAPEYAMLGHFSVKSGIFSFGVLILEIVSGQRNSHFNKGGDGG